MNMRTASRRRTRTTVRRAIRTTSRAWRADRPAARARQWTAGGQGLRSGRLGGWFRDNATPAARAAAALVAKSLGASADVTWPEAELGRAAAFVITSCEGGSLHLRDLRTRAAEFEP